VVLERFRRDRPLEGVAADRREQDRSASGVEDEPPAKSENASEKQYAIVAQ